ncbi:MAG: peptide-methionine (S)-S-oxide reductase [Pseudomonadota bacterium]
MTRQNNFVAIGFGGGCHWCTEAVFSSLRGVRIVEQGFVRSSTPNDTWSEAVRLRFDADAIPLNVLIDIHLRTHASTSDHKMRGNYRSAVYTLSGAQSDSVRAELAALQTGFEDPLVTQVLPLTAFRQSDLRFQRYFERNEGGPFCKRYIDPKLAYLRTHFAEYYAAESVVLPT